MNHYSRLQHSAIRHRERLLDLAALRRVEEVIATRLATPAHDPACPAPDQPEGAEQVSAPAFHEQGERRQVA